MSTSTNISALDFFSFKKDFLISFFHMNIIIKKYLLYQLRNCAPVLLCQHMILIINQKSNKQKYKKIFS